LINDITQIGATGLVAASQAADLYAQNIASVADPAFTPSAPTFSPLVTGGVAVLLTQTTQANGNPLLNTLGLMQASQQYTAAANLVRTGEELSATLLQTIA
jgi:flagellar hook protein FlgE